MKCTTSFVSFNIFVSFSPSIPHTLTHSTLSPLGISQLFLNLTPFLPPLPTHYRSFPWHPLALSILFHSPPLSTILLFSGHPILSHSLCSIPEPSFLLASSSLRCSTSYSYTTINLYSFTFTAPTPIPLSPLLISATRTHFPQCLNPWVHAPFPMSSPSHAYSFPSLNTSIPLTLPIFSTVLLSFHPPFPHPPLPCNSTHPPSLQIFTFPLQPLLPFHHVSIISSTPILNSIAIIFTHPSLVPTPVSFSPSLTLSEPLHIATPPILKY